MVLIQLKLNEVANDNVRMYMLLSKIKNKGEAVNQILCDIVFNIKDLKQRGFK